MSGAHWRQVDICPPAKLEDGVTIVGLGGIGSPTALILAKMGCKSLTLIDYDTVEIHNTSCQLFGAQDIGHTKLIAMYDILGRLTGLDCDVRGRNEKITPEAPLIVTTPVVISCVDSMAVRRLLWNAVKVHPAARMFIDSRMGAEFGRVLAVDLTKYEHLTAYETTLYTDAEAIQEPCTARAIAYTGFALGAQIAHLIKRRAMGQDVPLDSVIDFRTMLWAWDTRLLDAATGASG